MYALKAIPFRKGKIKCNNLCLYLCESSIKCFINFKSNVLINDLHLAGMIEGCIVYMPGILRKVDPIVFVHGTWLAIHLQTSWSSQFQNLFSLQLENRFLFSILCFIIV